jgi:opacity protein-like surface antigen
MKRVMVAVACAALTVAVISAQSQHANDDPDRHMAGSGQLPAGWHGRLDGDAAMSGVNMMQMGTGVHFMTGPAGIYYKNDKPSGTYRVEATFMQMEPAGHPEAYGLFIGGSDLEGPNQKYTYFEVRQDGRFLIKKRAGMQTPTVMNWTENAAVKKTDERGRTTNALAIAVAPGTVRFLVKGTEVASVPASEVDTSGIAGLRINHNLNVHVDAFSVK